MEHELESFEKDYSDIKGIDDNGIVLMMVQHFTGSSLKIEKEIFQPHLHVFYSNQHT